MLRGGDVRAVSMCWKRKSGRPFFLILLYLLPCFAPWPTIVECSLPPFLVAASVCMLALLFLVSLPAGFEQLACLSRFAAWQWFQFFLVGLPTGFEQLSKSVFTRSAKHAGMQTFAADFRM